MAGLDFENGTSLGSWLVDQANPPKIEQPRVVLGGSKWRKGVASWYEPILGGMNGNPEGGANAPRVKAKEIPWSVAHKTLKQGTLVQIRTKDVTDKGTTIVGIPTGFGKKTTYGKPIIVPVGDHGPNNARDFDLRLAVARTLSGGKKDPGVLDIEYKVLNKRIDLREYADKGGDAKALAEMVGTDVDPGAVADPGDVQSENPAESVSNAVGGNIGAIGEFLSGVVKSFVSGRIGRVIIGGGMVLLGLAWLGRSQLIGTVAGPTKIVARGVGRLSKQKAVSTKLGSKISEGVANAKPIKAAKAVVAAGR